MSDVKEVKKSVNYIKAVLVYFIVVLVAQLAFSDMWTGELKKIDLFQLVIAPSCCFAVAALFGWYKNAFTSLLSSFFILVLGSFFYLTFQKFTFFAGSTYENLFLINLNNLGVLIGISNLISAVLLATICHFSNKK